METKVYQLNTENRDLSMFISVKRGEELVELVKENLDQYELVALVDRSEVETNKILEEAYKLTNSIDYAWYEDERTHPMFPSERGGCRSTSVGDIIEFQGVKYVVDSYGFKCLED